MESITNAVLAVGGGVVFIVGIYLFLFCCFLVWAEIGWRLQRRRMRKLDEKEPIIDSIIEQVRIEMGQDEVNREMSKNA